MGLSHQGFVFVVMWLGYGGFGVHEFCFVHVVYLQLSFYFSVCLCIFNCRNLCFFLLVWACLMPIWLLCISFLINFLFLEYLFLSLLQVFDYSIWIGHFCCRDG